MSYCKECGTYCASIHVPGNEAYLQGKCPKCIDKQHSDELKEEYYQQQHLFCSSCPSYTNECTNPGKKIMDVAIAKTIIVPVNATGYVVDEIAYDALGFDGWRLVRYVENEGFNQVSENELPGEIINNPFSESKLVEVVIRDHILMQPNLPAETVVELAIKHFTEPGWPSVHWRDLPEGNLRWVQAKE